MGDDVQLILFHEHFIDVEYSFLCSWIFARASLGIFLLSPYIFHHVNFQLRCTSRNFLLSTDAELVQ